MSAYQLFLDPELESAVLQGALSLAEAWLLQDEYLLQQSDQISVPVEWQPMLLRLHLAEWEPPEWLRPQ